MLTQYVWGMNTAVYETHVCLSLALCSNSGNFLRALNVGMQGHTAPETDLYIYKKKSFLKFKTIIYFSESIIKCSSN